MGAALEGVGLSIVVGQIVPAALAVFVASGTLGVVVYLLRLWRRVESRTQERVQRARQANRSTLVS